MKKNFLDNDVDYWQISKTIKDLYLSDGSVNALLDFERVLEQNHDIGVICIEGARYDFPTADFLDAIMAKAKQHNIVIISDEITSGWRMTDGGVYKLNGYKIILCFFC